MRLVISQSMYFPWVGFLEQMRLAETFVRYDDVQFSRGSFTNRVQIKTAQGTRWLTVPLAGQHLGQSIREVELDSRTDWRERQRAQLSEAYRGAPYLSDMLRVVDDVFGRSLSTVSDLAYVSSQALMEYFGLNSECRVFDSSALGIAGSGSSRVLEITRQLGGSVYITGHGARRYLDHEAFERSNIEVRYMKYERMPYQQLHGAFTPYVSALDLVANCGRDGAGCIRSSTVHWKEFLDESS